MLVKPLKSILICVGLLITGCNYSGLLYIPFVKPVNNVRLSYNTPVKLPRGKQIAVFVQLGAKSKKAFSLQTLAEAKEQFIKRLLAEKQRFLLTDNVDAADYVVQLSIVYLGRLSSELATQTLSLGYKTEVLHLEKASKKDNEPTENIKVEKSLYKKVTSKVKDLFIHGPEIAKQEDLHVIFDLDISQAIDNGQWQQIRTRVLCSTNEFVSYSPEQDASLAPELLNKAVIALANNLIQE